MSKALQRQKEIKALLEMHGVDFSDRLEVTKDALGITDDKIRRVVELLNDESTLHLESESDFRACVKCFEAGLMTLENHSTHQISVHEVYGAGGPMSVPASMIATQCYLLGRDIGWHSEIYGEGNPLLLAGMPADPSPRLRF